MLIIFFFQILLKYFYLHKILRLFSQLKEKLKLHNLSLTSHNYIPNNHQNVLPKSQCMVYVANYIKRTENVVLLPYHPNIICIFLLYYEVQESKHSNGKRG